MKHVKYTDDQGYIRRVQIRDEDDESAAEYGVPAGPPDVRNIDWEAMKRDINNILANKDCYTWDDVQRDPNAIRAVTNLLKRRVIALYREEQ